MQLAWGGGGAREGGESVPCSLGPGFALLAAKHFWVGHEWALNKLPYRTSSPRAGDKEQEGVGGEGGVSGGSAAAVRTGQSEDWGAWKCLIALQTHTLVAAAQTLLSGA